MRPIAWPAAGSCPASCIPASGSLDPRAAAGATGSGGAVTGSGIGATAGMAAGGAITGAGAGGAGLGCSAGIGAIAGAAAAPYGAIAV